MYKSVFEKNYENQHVIDKYEIKNDDICHGSILMRRYRSTSFLGIDKRVWKLKNFSIENNYFYFWRVEDSEYNPELIKKIKLKDLRCGRMFSSKEWIPTNFDYNKRSKKCVFKFNVYRGYNSIMKFASIRLDSIETLYDELSMAFENSYKFE